MIVKMTILRLLGSSDDKEKEKIDVARPEKIGSALKPLRSEAPEEPTHDASVHPMVVGRIDAMTEGNQSQVSLWAPDEPMGQKRGIGALGVLCSRDDVKSPGEVSSAPVQPTVHRSIASLH